MKLGDSSYSPNGMQVPRRMVTVRGRATDRTRGLHRLSRPDELRMLALSIHAVRGRVLRSVPERRRIQTAV